MARWHRRQGRRVRVFKTGPDFLDPQILERASGAPVYSLHLWMVGEAACRALLEEAAQNADLILIEGVMGLFDGKPSGADLAETFNIPVLAVIDGQAMAQTFAAIAFGLARFRPSLPFYGVFANRINTQGHADLLQENLPEGIAWTGHLPSSADISLPSRHLGLAQANEVVDLDERLDRAADALSQTSLAALPPNVIFSPDSGPVRLSTPLRLSASVPSAASLSLPASVPSADSMPLAASVSSATSMASLSVNTAALAGRRIAIARDAAFAFIYPANVDLLKAMGATVTTFSPLADEPIPPECDALFLPGGYPELHAEQLSHRGVTAASLHSHIEAGKPVLAECGGMLYLLDTLQDVAGKTWPMLGILPGSSAMQTKLAALGMHRLATPAGEIRGHTFHYSRTQSPMNVSAQSRHATRDSLGEHVYVQGKVIATYFHAYWPSNPEAIAALFNGSLFSQSPSSS